MELGNFQHVFTDMSHGKDLMIKKNATFTCSGPEEVKRKIFNLANVRGITPSEYMFNLIVKDIEEKETETRIMVEALHLNIKDI